MQPPGPQASSLDSGEKIPGDFEPPLGWRTRLRRWFLPCGDTPWPWRMRWGRLAAVFATLVGAAYMALAVFAFWFVHYHRGVREVRFVDLVAPWRWSRYAVERGNQYVEAAKQFKAERKYREALWFVAEGVRRSPANRDGRLLLAEMLVAAQRPDFARDALLEGMRNHGTDPVFLTPLLTFLLYRQEDDRVIVLAQQQGALAGEATEAARLLAVAGATASWFRGNYDQAEDFLRAVPTAAASRHGRLLAAKIERDRGYAQLALLQVRQLAAEAPGDAEIHRELVGQLRQLDRENEARRESLVFQIAHPSAAAPRVELLLAYRIAGDTAHVAAEVDAVLCDFARDEAMLLSLADFAASGGNTALVRRVERHAGERQMPTAPYALLFVEAAIVAGDFRGALEAIRACTAPEHDWDRRHRALFDSFQAIAHQGLGDAASARLFLANFLAQPNLRAENLLAVANRFAALNANEHAWKTLERAHHEDEMNQAVLARLIELDLLLNRVDTLVPHVQRFLKMRRPSPEILRVVQQRLGSDLFLFSPEAPPVLEAIAKRLALSRNR